VGRGIARVIQEKDPGITVTGLADSRSGIMDPEGIDLPAAVDRKEKTGICGDLPVSPLDVVDGAEYDALVEVSPTRIDDGEPAITHIVHALSRGKHVVTSNKGPIALAHRRLHALAVSHGVQLRYEATVCGAIPVLHVLQHDLLGNQVQALHGVMNGTCNFILTRMEDEGLTYDQALAEAREMGYAEADPTYDVKGIDAALKLVILANTVWDLGVTLDDVEITGIDLITPEAIRLACDRETTIRLIAEAIPEKGLLRVSPRIIPQGHPLLVEGTLNAVTLHTDLAGELTFIGKGAGSVETASAVIGDLLYLGEHHAGAH
jgi:homoserine dehydrogenase